MQDRLKAAWRYTGKELWNPLFRKFKNDHPDLPIEIVRVLLVRPKATRQIFVEAGHYGALDKLRADEATYLDSVQDARLALRQIQPEFFIDGLAVGHALSEVSASLAGYGNPALEGFYEERLAGFLTNHSLPYRLRTAPLRLMPLLPGELDALYVRLCARARQEQGLQEALDAFEEAWHAQTQDWSRINGKNAIRAASLLAENMLLAATNGRDNEFSRALTRFRNENRFPSNEFANIFDRAYTFANTYPNIRHPGNPQVQRRELKQEDALLSALIFIGLSSCIHSMCEDGG